MDSTNVFGYFILLFIFISLTYCLLKINKFKVILTKETFNYYTKLEGLRGFLALSVFFHHALIHYNFLSLGVWQSPDSRFYTNLGQLAVGFFFITTAFLFTDKVNQSTDVNWDKLYQSRFKRILPMYIFATLLVIIIAIASSELSLFNIFKSEIENVLKAFGFGFYGYPDIGGIKNTFIINAYVYWTLYFEWCFYLFLPMLAFLNKKYKPTTLLILLTVLVFLSEKGFLYFFISGITLAKYKAHKFQINKYIYDIILVVGLLILLNMFKTAFGFKQALIAGICFYCILNGNGLLNYLTALPVRWLGAISYSVYVLHGIVISLAVMIMSALQYKWTATNYWIITLLMGLSIILISSFSYVHIEKRFNQK